MKIVPFDDTAWHMDHPKGTVAFNYLLFGNEPDSLSNYRYILGRQEGDFHMPRHRHTFEQIRLPLIGDMHLGEQGILHEGEVGYFPEGQTYGPQDDPLTDPSSCSWSCSSADPPAWVCGPAAPGRAWRSRTSCAGARKCALSGPGSRDRATRA